MDRFNRFMEPFWVFLNRGYVVRRLVLGFAIWMTYDSYQWAKWYALTEDPSDFIYTAILGAASLMLTAALNLYNNGKVYKVDGKTKENEGKN